MVRKKTRTELQLAEIKYRNLLDKRDALNEDAKVFRDERDTLNEERRESNEKMQAMKEQRDALVTEMRIHKKERNECQKKAKELIEIRRKRRKDVGKNLGLHLERLRKDIENLQKKQETVPMELKDENLLLEEMKRKRLDIEECENIYKEQQEISEDIENLDDSIDSLFKKADAEHEMVVRLSEEAQGIHEKIIDLVKEISHLIAEANKKHDEFSEIREKADHYHKRAMEMKSKVLSIKSVKREEEREARRILKQQKIEVKEALDSEEKREKAADEALETLLKKKKVEMR